MDIVTKPNAPATIAAQAKSQTKCSLSSDVTTSTLSSLSSLSTLKDDSTTPGAATDGKPKSKAQFELTATVKPWSTKLQHVAIPLLPKSRSPSPVQSGVETPVQAAIGEEVSSNKQSSSSSSELQTFADLTTTTREIPSNSLSKLLADQLCEEVATVSIPPAWSSLENPYIKQRALDPERLGTLDRLLYNFERGAPANSNDLPHRWQEAKQLLFDDGEITFDDLDSREATSWIKNRYEDLRLGVEAFFGSKSEPTDERDWPLTRAEGFDVFDKPSSVKYWKKRKYSLVDRTTFDDRINYIRQREISESEDEAEYKASERVPTEEEAIDDYGDDYKSDHKKSAHAMVEANNTSVIDLQDVGGHEMSALLEIMQAKDVQSSEAVMGWDEMSELLLTQEQHLANIPNEQDIIPNAIASPCPPIPRQQYRPLYIEYTSQPESESGCTHVEAELTSGKQPDVCSLGSPSMSMLLTASEPDLSEQTNAVANDDSEGSRSARLLYRAKKRKARTLSPQAVNVYEDDPGRSPLIRQLVAQNPPSPGTDLPTENLNEVLTSSQRSSQGEARILTPQANRRRRVITSPIGRFLVRPRASDLAGPYRSLFGGPAGPQSSPNN